MRARTPAAGGRAPGSAGHPGALATLVALVLATIPATPAAAQPAFELRAGHPLPALASAPTAPDPLRTLPPWTTPAMSATTPTGLGAEWGDVWAEAGFQHQTAFSLQAGSAAGVGFGLGDAREELGLQVRVVTFARADDDFGETGGLDLHLHRTLPQGFGFAVGWENAFQWDPGFDDRSSNVYGVLSKWVALAPDDREPFSALLLSAGLGTGRFQDAEDWRSDRDGLGVFGSAGIRVLPPVSVIAEWTGQDLLLAASGAPFREVGLVVTAGITSVTGRPDRNPRFLVGGNLNVDLAAW